MLKLYLYKFQVFEIPPRLPLYYIIHLVLLEEDVKRKNMNAIQYSYDVPQNPENEVEGIPTVEQAEEEYVPPPILDVPVDISIVSNFTLIC